MNLYGPRPAWAKAGWARVVHQLDGDVRVGHGVSVELHKAITACCPGGNRLGEERQVAAEDYGLARRMWHQLEPIHAVFWYAPRALEEAAALGYDVTARWPSYFAWRAAPLGAAGPKLVTSAFYSFSPAMVAEHVPSAWAVASPQQVLAARERAADQVYRALFGDRIGAPGLAEAAGLAREAALAAGTAGRTLAAANADLPWPGEPHLTLWHAIGVLREHRGDGHIT